MKIKGYVFPDNCPIECLLKMQITIHGQCRFCDNCPVAMDKDEALKYGDDWLIEWNNYFTNGIVPKQGI